MSVGNSVIRKDAYAKVTGREKFTSDLYFPGMLYGKLVMSDRPHAIVKGIYTKNAFKVKGVRAILTHRDIPGKNRLPLIFDDMPFLAEDTVRYHGHVIALIVAEKRHIADLALRYIDIKYEDLSPILSIEDGLNNKENPLFGDDNIFKSYVIKRGDVEGAFKGAHLVVKNTYKTPYQEHTYLENQSMLAYPEPDGGITVYGSMQCPFYVRDAVAAILGLPLSRVRVIQAATGGGFGGKEDVPSLIAAYAALMAFKTSRPVLLSLSREEDMVFSSKRHPGLIHYETAFDRSGFILGVRVRYYLNAGAYATLSPVVLWRGTVHAVGPYRVSNIDVEAFAVATNLVPCGAYRGFGTPQILFAHERQMDEAAKRLGINPARIREINLIDIGDKTPTGQLLKESVGIKETLKRAIEDTDFINKYNEASDDDNEWQKGIGLSTVFYGVGLGAGGKHLARSGAFVQINLDGSVEIAVGQTEMGQGLKTVVSQIAASELGIPYSMVNIVDIDTSRVPDSGPTVASRGTFMAGNAVIIACRELKERLLPVFRKIWKRENIILDGLLFKDGMVHYKSDSSLSVPFNTVIKSAILEHKINLSTIGWYRAPFTSFSYENGEGDAYFTYSYATNVVELMVNINTGELKIKKITACLDVGKAINPQQVEGQIQGGSLQGLGYSWLEEIKHKDGIMQTNNLSTYIIPTTLDTPTIKPIIVEVPYSKGPFGSKGFGELPLMGIAPAVANAVSHAIDRNITEIPLTPERLLDIINR